MILALFAGLMLAPGQVLRFEHLVMHAPLEFVLETRKGPDFALYYLHPRETSTPVMGLYLGNFP